MQFGLYLRPALLLLNGKSRAGAWHIVSEDSLPEAESFLLIVRTGWIFTASSLFEETGTTGYSEFPAYSQVCQSRTSDVLGDSL